MVVRMSRCHLRTTEKKETTATKRDGHWCLDERLLDRFPRPLFPSGPHLCECHGRYRNPAAPLLSLAQCPVPSARCPVRSVSRRRSVRSQVPSHAPSGVPTTTALSSAPGDCPAFQREKSLARNIPSGEKAGELASHPCRAPSQHQAGTPPRPPLPIPAFRPPGPRSSLPRTSSRRLLAAWPGLVVRFHLSHLPRFLLSSSSSPSPPATASPASPFV